MNDFISFAARVMGVEASSLSPETEYGSGRWDSLMHMRLVMEAEEEYGIEIPIEDIPKIRRLGDFDKYIHQN